MVQDFFALLAGDELEPLKLQYKDYAEWQQSPSMQASLLKQEEYWLKEFAGEIPLLDLPYDHARPLTQDFAGSSIHFQIDQDQAIPLIEMARSQGATLFMVLLAIYNILLAHLSNQEDIVVGTPIAGRKHADLEK